MNLTPEILKLVSHVLVAKPFWPPFFLGSKRFAFWRPPFIQLQGCKLTSKQKPEKERESGLKASKTG